MSEQRSDPKIEELEKRLDELVRTQISFQAEVNYIRAQIQRLRNESVSASDASRPAPTQPAAPKAPYAPQPTVSPRPTQQVRPPTFGTEYQAHKTQPTRPQFGDKVADYVSARTEDARGNLEKFIGENLISKIGIVVLILGVGIFAKYAIDNGWITPLMRVVFGYAIGFGLLGVAIKLRDKYRDFSAVLLSGGMAIMYFITYFAYANYGLMPQMLAFVLMVFFTVVTVVAAVVYNRQIIAHIGLVGAYAVPFMLSNNSGAYAILFAYMAILNAGILVISVVKSWRSIFYTSSVFTWIIFAAWFVDKYRFDQHFSLALVFLAIFFTIFFVTTLVHGVIHDHEETNEGVISAAVTAVIFYCFCLGIGDVKTSVSNYAFYFSYIAAFSLAILVSSFRFYGRLLLFVAYPFAWIVFGTWFFSHYDREIHFSLAATFASIFFAIFYGTAMFFRLRSDDVTTAEVGGMLLTNSFIYYGFGYALLDSRENLRQYEGLFTVTHSAFHFIVAQIVARLKNAKSDVVQILTILIVTFATIAVPVQFDGHYITMLWSVEAALLYYFGRSGRVSFFEYLSYPVMLLATCSLFVNWGTAYVEVFAKNAAVPRPFANSDFLTGLIFIASFVAIHFIDRRQKAEPAIGAELGALLRFGVVGLATFALYNTFRVEIGNYFQTMIASLAAIRSPGDPGLQDMRNFNVLAQLNYTLLFLAAFAWINILKGRSVVAAGINIAFSLLAIAIALTLGMFLLYELRVNYMNNDAVGLFGTAASNIAARYVTYLFIGLLLVALYQYCRDVLLEGGVSRAWRAIAFDALVYPTILIISSCELMNIAAQLHVADAEKYGLSILWAAYALAVIIIGIKWAKKYLRFGAIALIGVTLLKLFFFDATDLPTIPKTILFVSIGLLLLGISFLYNKFRNALFASVSNEEEAKEL